MLIAALADSALQKEVEEKGFPASIQISWTDKPDFFAAAKADVYLDLVFQNTPDRVRLLQNFAPKPVIINAVTTTLAELKQPWIRVNAWPGFLKRDIIEIAIPDDIQAKVAGSIFQQLNWPFVIVPDKPGMVAARVIAMIVNEAYFALGDGVSTKAEIDMAMKAGANYPYGPFEWSERIGLGNIFDLLSVLSKTDERYLVARALEQDLEVRL